MRNGLTSDGILLVVLSEDDLGDMLEPLDTGVGTDEGVTDEEDEADEWKELHCPVTASTLGVLAWTQAEVESQDDQVGHMLGLLVG